MISRDAEMLEAAGPVLVSTRPEVWGEWKETRWIIAVMIGHDPYHAGEINHIGSLHQQSDS